MKTVNPAIACNHAHLCIDTRGSTDDGSAQMSTGAISPTAVSYFNPVAIGSFATRKPGIGLLRLDESRHTSPVGLWLQVLLSVTSMMEDIESLFFEYDSVSRWGLDEIETVVCPSCQTAQEIEVVGPD